MKLINKAMLPTVLSVIITTLTVGMIVFAAPWADPTATPPGDNAPTPINISEVGQVKDGGLILNTAGARVGLIVKNGSMGIGTESPSNDLKLDVEGKIGAKEYCDQDGNNCHAAAGGGGGTFTCSSIVSSPTQTGDAICSNWGGACVGYDDFGRGYHDEFYNWPCSSKTSDRGFKWRCCKVQ